MRRELEAAIAAVGDGGVVDIAALVDAALDESPLEVVRAQLASVLLSVRDEIGELVQRDYAAFITLSSQLEGMDAGLLRLRAPFAALSDALARGRACTRLQALDEAAILLGQRASAVVAVATADASTAIDLLSEAESAASSWRLRWTVEPSRPEAEVAAHEAYAVAGALTHVRSRLADVACRLEPALEAMRDLLVASLDTAALAAEHYGDGDGERQRQDDDDQLRSVAEGFRRGSDIPLPPSAPASVVAIQALAAHTAAVRERVIGAQASVSAVCADAGASMVEAAWRALLLAGLQECTSDTSWVHGPADVLLAAASTMSCGEEEVGGMGIGGCLGNIGITTRDCPS